MTQPKEIPLKSILKNYAIFRDGSVLNLKFNRFLKGTKSKSGYVYMNLTVDGKMKAFYAHRLVATVYLKPQDGRVFVNHKNGIKSDNNHTNLEWCTHSENIKHAHENRIQKRRKSEMSSKCREMIIFLRTKYEVKQIADFLGYSSTSIYNVINKKVILADEFDN